MSILPSSDYMEDLTSYMKIKVFLCHTMAFYCSTVIQAITAIEKVEVLINLAFYAV